jgi:hypothetical protein
MPIVSIPYYLFNLFHYSPLPLLPPYFSTAFNTYIFYLHSLHFMILLKISHSLFLSLFTWVPQSSSTITNVLHLSLRKIMLVFLSMFILWIYITCMTENMWPLCFWAWLTSLNMMSSNSSTYLQTTCHYSLWLIWLSNKLCVCTTFSWSIHKL